MADKKTVLPPGIYETKVDTGESDVPNVPEPETPLNTPESEVSREEWEPEFIKYKREHGLPDNVED